MIEIKDTDLPITVAEKIINGTKAYDDASPLAKALYKTITGKDNPVMDMFNIDEIREIANYLLIYANIHDDNDYGVTREYADCEEHTERPIYISDTGKIVQEDENGCLNLTRENAVYRRVMGVKGIKNVKDETF